jgi:hypothetical protein
MEHLIALMLWALLGTSVLLAGVRFFQNRGRRMKFKVQLVRSRARHIAQDTRSLATVAENSRLSPGP